MDYTGLNDCFEILNQKPNWFFHKENIAEKVRCLDMIQQVGSPNLIERLFKFLRSDTPMIQAKAAETILVLFKQLKSLHDYADALKYVPIEKTDLDLYRVNFDEKIYTQLLAVASLNSNGYVREKAVKELAELKRSEGFKFIILRLADWVYEVRNAANDAVWSYLDQANVDDLLNHLHTLDWLLTVKRVDLREVHKRIVQFVVNQEFTSDFYNKIQKLDDKIRFRFYKHFLATKSPSEEQIKMIGADKSFLIRGQLMKYLGRFESAIRKEIIRKYLQDHSATVKLQALYESARFKSEFDEELIILLSDKAASIRELSRNLLASRGMNFPQLYRKRINEKKFLSGSILGLSETGSHEDLSTLEQNVRTNNDNIVVACLVAINKFSPDKAKHYALELLVHKSKKVRQKAVDIIAKNMDPQVLESVRDIYANGGYDVKKSVLMLFNMWGGYSVIGDLLLALTDENIKIQNLAWQFVEKWKVKAVRLFTTPQNSDLERARQIYSDLKPGQMNLTHPRTSLLNQLRFYLQ
jgi:hypothetical protein